MRRQTSCKFRVGWDALSSAANLFGITRTAQGSAAFAGKRRTSTGVLLSLPGQKGQLSANEGTVCGERRTAKSSGRLARSVAMMTHSLVKKFWRSSGMEVLQLGSSAKMSWETQPTHHKTRPPVTFPAITAVVESKHPLMSNKLPIGILGATGVVGQRFIQMLERHPWFEVAWLAASDRSEGKTYGEAARWRLKTAIPANIAAMKVSPATPDGAPKIIFAALDASIAAEMEPRFAEAG